MNKKLIFFIFCCLWITHVNANPFYAKPTTENNAQNELAQFEENSPGCMPNEQVNFINMTADFDTLKFIGVIQKEDVIKALFLDDKNKIITLHRQDYLTQQQIQITDIDLKSIQYILWSKVSDCHRPIKTSLTL